MSLSGIPRVYPITDTAISQLSHAEQVVRFCAGGASLIQLREKRLSPRLFYEEAKRALTEARNNQCQLIINDRVDLALALGADGVHLGQDDMPADAARRLLGSKSIIGYSTHNVHQARQAIKLPIDYLAIGPIFKTTSKLDTAPELGLEGLKAVRSIVGSLPLVAIGGIDHSNAQAVIAAGADAVALISALLRDPSEISQTTRQLFKILSG